MLVCSLALLGFVVTLLTRGVQSESCNAFSLAFWYETVPSCLAYDGQIVKVLLGS